MSKIERAPADEFGLHLKGPQLVVPSEAFGVGDLHCAAEPERDQISENLTPQDRAPNGVLVLHVGIGRAEEYTLHDFR